MNRPCQYCVAAWGFDAEDCLFSHYNDVAPLALGLARAVQGGEPTDEQIGWMMWNANRIFEDVEHKPKRWKVTNFEFSDDPALIATFKVNRIKYAFTDDEDSSAVRLSDLRRWEREADIPRQESS